MEDGKIKMASNNIPKQNIQNTIRGAKENAVPEYIDQYAGKYGIWLQNCGIITIQ